MQILYILKATPTYVYLLFSYLIFIGIKAIKPRIISCPIKLFIMPLVFLFLSIKRLTNIEDFLLIVTLVFISIFINKNILKAPLVEIENDTIILPGSWQPLLTIIVVFSIKYFFGYMKAVMPEVAQKYKMIDIAISSFVIGMTFFKAWFYYRYVALNRIKGQVYD